MVWIMVVICSATVAWKSDTYHTVKTCSFNNMHRVAAVFTIRKNLIGAHIGQVISAWACTATSMALDRFRSPAVCR
jgi:hypothetical protein